MNKRNGDKKMALGGRIHGSSEAGVSTDSSGAAELRGSSDAIEPRDLPEAA